MKILTKHVLLILLIFLIISGIFSLFEDPFEKDQILSLSEVVQEIENIQEMIIAGNNVFLVFEDGTKARTRKEPEVSFIQTLKNYNVSPESLQKINIKTQEEKGAWISTALVFFFPLLIFVFIFFFLFRQMKAGASQAFNFTKAKAKIFGAEGHSKEKIGFDDVAGLKEAKEELKEIVDFLKNPQKYLKMGAKISGFSSPSPYLSSNSRGSFRVPARYPSNRWMSRSVCLMSKGRPLSCMGNWTS